MASLTISRGYKLFNNSHLHKITRLTSAGLSKKAKTGAQTSGSDQAFDNTQYLCQEYFNHDKYAFFDFDVEMKGDRLDCPNPKEPVKIYLVPVEKK